MNFKSVIAMIDIREYSRTLTLNISKMLYPNRNLSYTIHQYYPELTGVSIPGSMKFVVILVMRLHIAHKLHCSLTLFSHAALSYCSLTLFPHTALSYCSLTLPSHTALSHCSLTLLSHYSLTLLSHTARSGAKGPQHQQGSVRD